MRSLAVMAVALGGCTGVIDLPLGGGTGGGDADPKWQLRHYACDSAAVAPELPLRRLSRVQYANAVSDLVAGIALGGADRSAVQTVVTDALERYPEDRVVGDPAEPHGGYSRLDQAVQQAHVDVSYDLAVDLGLALTSSTARRTALMGACATDASTTNDAQCLSTFISSFGRRALRRPVTSAEMTWYAAVAGATPVDAAAVADIVALLLTSPQFLYHVEEGDPAAAGPVALDAHALAARLSFHFWQAPPDSELRAAADSGALLTDDGYRTQVMRLVNDPRADAAIDTFFAQWFRLDDLKPINALVGTAVYDAFAGTDSPSMDLNVKMQGEVVDATRWVTRHTGKVKDLLTDRGNFARTVDLAALYGETPWDGTSAPTSLHETERAGLLTRAVFLASGSGNTRPIIKGYRIRNALLCETIPPPPNNVNARPIDLSPDLTTRETVEALTQQTGTSCISCHGSLLNPLGFVSENFDALGRHRSGQRLFNPDGTLNLTKPVNTTVVPHVVGLETETLSVADLSAGIAASGAFETCFSREYFRYSFGRIEDEAKDGCALKSLQDDALAGKTIVDLLAATALSPQFKQRDFR